MNKPLLAIGLMSGTSMDGIDAALVRTDGLEHVERLGFASLPYDDGFRQRLRAAVLAAQSISAPAPEAEPFKSLGEDLARRHAAAIGLLGVDLADVDLIGFHGHTLVHRPDQGWTWQFGDAQLLAQLTGRPVAHDFRGADVALGGQGAPLVPLYHAALAAGLERPLAVLNIGGVANVTYLGQDILAFDTGPGNALVDDWALAHTGKAMDEAGALAAGGRVREDVLTAMLDHPYFDAPPPKSLDRQDFSHAAAHGLSAPDGAATLTAFTAEAARLALAHLPQAPARWLVTGGGRHNPTLMGMLRERLGAVEPVEAVGWNGDALEAEAFGYLAVRTLKGLPLSLPGTTGVPAPATGGRIAA